MPSSPRSSNATGRSCAGARWSSVGPAARTRAASSRPPATRPESSASIPRCRCARRTAAVRRGIPAGRRPSLPGGQPRRDGDPSALHAAGRADLDRRGVPRRDRVRGAVRRRAGDRPADQGRDAGGGRADRLGRGREHEARGQDRVGPAQARRAGRRAGRRGGGVPRAAADLAAVGRRREDRRRAQGLRRPDDRRPGGAPAGPARPAVREARRVACALGRAGSMPTRSTTAIRPSRSATSTRSMSTPATPSSSSGRCWRWPTASAGRLRSARRPGRDRRGQDPRQRLPDDHPATDARRADRHDRPILRDRARAGPARDPRACGSGCWA